LTTANNGEKSGFLKTLRQDMPAVLIIMAAIATGIIIYPYLPDQVPAHWNIAGQVDRYTSRFWGAFGIPLLTLGIYLLMIILPGLDPKRQNYNKFRGSYRIIKLSFVLFMAWIYAVVLLNTFNGNFPVDRTVITAIGLLFILLGNFMSRFRHNYFVGIKTPWTLASEDVWSKTHRFGSRVWVIAGLVIAAAGIFIGGRQGFALFITAIAAAALIPVIYSYIIYKKTA